MKTTWLSCIRTQLKWFKSGGSRDSKIGLHFVDQTGDLQTTNFSSGKKIVF